MGSQAWWTIAGRSSSSRAPRRRVVDALSVEANGRGGLDNITAIVVQVTATEGNNGGTTPRLAETPVAR
jgi:hypothetical protein